MRRRALGILRGPWRFPGIFVLGVLDGSFLPFPIGVAVAAMVLADRKSWALVLALVTLGNLVGGAMMVALGAWAFEAAAPILGLDGSEGVAADLRVRLDEGAFVAALASSFPPTPFPLVAFLAGAVGAPLGPLLLGAGVGKTARYAVIAVPLALFGDRAIRMWNATPVWFRRVAVLSVGLVLLGVAILQLV